MTYDIDIILDVYLTAKEYILPKDYQAVADHIVSVLADYNMSDTDIAALKRLDKYMSRAVVEYLDDNDDDDYSESDEE